MFEKVFEFIAEWRDRLMPFTVIDSYEEGVIMRLGNCRKVVMSDNGLWGTGLHLKWPIIETDITEPIKPRVVGFHGRSLTTKDGKNIAVSVAMTYRIHNIRKALLDVHDVDNSLDDIGQLVTARTIAQFDYKDLTSEAFSKALLSNARERGFKFGIEVMDIGLSEFAPVRTIRLVEGR